MDFSKSINKWGLVRATGWHHILHTKSKSFGLERQIHGWCKGDPVRFIKDKANEANEHLSAGSQKHN